MSSTTVPCVRRGGSYANRLVVKVVEAHNLNSKAGQCDSMLPYCVVDYDRTEQLSKESTGANPLWNSQFIFDSVRSECELYISIWDKNAPDGNDFLGLLKVRPALMPDKITDSWIKLQGRDRADNIKGECHVLICFHPGKGHSININDFDLMKVIGKGSFGKVMQVKKKDTGIVYAMKILRKNNIIERDEVEHTQAERHVLATVDSPFLVSLKFCFQTPEKIYMVLDYVHGGELFYHLQQVQKFDEERSRFYISEMVLAIEHLHAKDIVYRDLKPENILLDYNGHVVLTDFGLCKEGMNKDEKTNTFCGTAEYLAPEILKGIGYGKEVDWWSLGILLYEMLTGIPPFFSENANLMYKKILYHEIKFPPTFSSECIDLMKGLLTRNPEERLGGGENDSAPIRAHPFFEEINWQRLFKKQIIPPFKPHLKSNIDVSNFDTEFTNEMAQDSIVESSDLSMTAQRLFDGFTYEAAYSHLNVNATSL